MQPLIALPKHTAMSVSAKMLFITHLTSHASLERTVSGDPITGVLVCNETCLVKSPDLVQLQAIALTRPCRLRRLGAVAAMSSANAQATQSISGASTGAAIERRIFERKSPIPKHSVSEVTTLSSTSRRSRGREAATLRRFGATNLTYVRERCPSHPGAKRAVFALGLPAPASSPGALE